MMLFFVKSLLLVITLSSLLSIITCQTTTDPYSGPDQSDTPTSNKAPYCDPKIQAKTSTVSWEFKNTEWSSQLRIGTKYAVSKIPVVGGVMKYSVNLIWPNSDYRQGIQNQLNCKLDSLVNGDVLADQIYDVTLQNNFYNIKAWFWAYANVGLESNYQLALEYLNNGLEACAASYNFVNSLDSDTRSTMIPFMVQLGQIHMVGLREAYLYYSTLVQGQTITCDGGYSSDACIIKGINQRGRDLSNWYNKYMSWFDTNYNHWSTWRAGLITCEESHQDPDFWNSQTAKNPWTLRDKRTDQSFSASAAPYFSLSCFNSSVATGFCIKTRDSIMGLLTNYMMVILEPVWSWHMYVPWMASQSFSCSQCLIDCQNSNSCHRNNTQDKSGNPKCSLIPNPDPNYVGSEICDDNCLNCSQTCISDTCNEDNYGAGCTNCLNNCESSQMCTDQCVTCQTNCVSGCEQCKMTENIPEYAQSYIIGPWSQQLNEYKQYNSILTGWNTWYDRVTWDSHEGLIHKFDISYFSDKRIESFQAHYINNGEYHAGKAGPVSSSASQVTLTFYPQSQWRWPNNVTLSWKKTGEVLDGFCYGTGVISSKGQIPSMHGFMIQDALNTLKNQFMYMDYSIPDGFLNQTSSSSYMITKLGSLYYKPLDVNNQYLYAVSFQYEHWQIAYQKYNEIDFPSIPLNEFKDFNISEPIPILQSNTGSCDVGAVFAPAPSASTASEQDGGIENVRDENNVKEDL